MHYGTDNIMLNIPSIRLNVRNVLHIPSVPHNIVMDLNDVLMLALNPHPLCGCVQVGASSSHVLCYLPLPSKTIHTPWNEVNVHTHFTIK